MIRTSLSPSQTQSERLQALYHMAVELSALHSLESVLNTALQHCLALTESQFGFVGLNTPNGRALDVVAMQGFFPQPEFYEHNHIIPLRPSIFARAVLENRPVRTEDARFDPSRFGQPSGHPPVAAFLGVPLRIRDKPIGMIGVANRPQPYDEDHEQLLLTYAAQVAIVIRNAQLYEQLTTAKAALEEADAGSTTKRQLSCRGGAAAARLAQVRRICSYFLLTRQAHIS